MTSLRAKTNPDVVLLTHLLEVGYVARFLLEKGNLRPLIAELSDALDVPEKDAISLASYLAACHDLGKCHPDFQAKLYPDGVTNPFKKQIDLLYSMFSHNEYSKTIAERIWQTKHRFSDHTAEMLSPILQYHHQWSRPAMAMMLPLEPQMDVRLLYQNMQDEIEDILFKTFQPPTSFSPVDWSAAGVLLWGILIASDWIASGDAISGHPVPPDEAASFIEHVMPDFLQDNHLMESPLPDGISSIQKLFPFLADKPLRPMQREVENLFQHGTTASGILIEAPMGEGKTEAAIYAAYRLAKEYGKNGFYIALPTSATSNQMETRINAMLRAQGCLEAKLMHSMAWLEQEPCHEDSIFTAPLKRGLLEPYAVGTIDQAMLSVMMARYSILRLVGLATKVLIIDELHSYDAYMKTTIERLLSWCYDLGIPVVMLSATLPLDKKQAYAKAFHSGFKNLTTQYPCITAFQQEEEAVEREVEGSHQHQNISLQLKQDGEEAVQEEVHKLFVQSNDQGCICVLRNTVDQAQETYQKLRAEYGSIVTLFHARFLYKDRQRIEKAVCQTFGGKERPQKAILVATQVVEQSLDLDFDAMITDLAPIDLLFQRTGRIFRHEREGRPFPNGQLTVLLPEEIHLHSSIYPAVLLNRTQHLLQERDCLHIPQDIPHLVQYVYQKAEQPEDTVEGENFYEDFCIETSNSSQLAKAVIFPEPDESRFFLATQGSGIDGFRDELAFLSVSTREGAAQNTVAFLPSEDYLEIQAVLQKKQPLSYAQSREIALHSVHLSSRLFSPKNNMLKGTGRVYGTYILPFPADHIYAETAPNLMISPELGVSSVH